MQFKEDWDAAKQRLMALWNNEIIDRCCIAITTPKNNTNYIEPVILKDDESLEKYYTHPELVLERNIKKFENTYYGGEAFPNILPFFGTGGHSGYFKNAKLKFAKDTIWFENYIHNWDNDVLEYDTQSKIFETQKNLMKYLVEQAKGRYFVSMPDNCGSLDGVAQIRGTQNLLLDLIEDPERVMLSTSLLVQVLKITGDELFDIIKENNEGGSTHGWMYTWSQGKHMQLQCDFSVMISPKMFEEFVLPELEETVSWLDNSIYHLDGQEQIKHLDMILSIKKLNMIQWTPVAGQPCTSDFIPVFQKIQKAGKGLVLIPESREVEKLLSELSPKGLQLVIRDIGSESEAREMIRKVTLWTK